MPQSKSLEDHYGVLEAEILATVVMGLIGAAATIVSAYIQRAETPSSGRHEYDTQNQFPPDVPSNDRAPSSSDRLKTGTRLRIAGSSMLWAFLFCIIILNVVVPVFSDVMFGGPRPMILILLPPLWLLGIVGFLLWNIGRSIEKAGK